MDIRPMAKADAEALAQIFYDAVRSGTANHYDQSQRAAWCPAKPRGPDWAARLDGLICYVAHDPIPVGFMCMAPHGYVDLAFVTPSRMGQGVAFALYAALEQVARARGLTRLTAHASHLAKPFFMRQGWQVDAPHTITRRGVLLENWIMSKSLLATRNV